jgi:hypothetical protein
MDRWTNKETVAGEFPNILSMGGRWVDYLRLSLNIANGSS